MLIRDWAPGLPQFRGYERSWLRGDVVAGVTVAAYLVPQVMAYATVAGLPPVVGLWAALAPLAVYAVLGSSRQLSVGPESTTALMTATALAPLAAGDPGRYAALAAAAALLVGVICFVAGLVRLGFLAELLSRPVLIGYMAGVAAIMIASQLGKVSGVDVDGEEFLDQMRSFISGVDGVHWPTIALAVSVLVVLLVLARLAPRMPGPLIAILGSALVVSLLSLDRNGIKVVGDIPTGLPIPGFTAIPLADLAAMVIPVAGVAIVAFSDNVLTARTFAVRNGYDVDANAELRALGVCNVGAGLMHGFPVSSSGSRTALGDAVGSRTQLYSVVMLVVVLAVMLFGRELLANVSNCGAGAHWWSMRRYAWWTCQSSSGWPDFDAANSLSPWQPPWPCWCSVCSTAYLLPLCSRSSTCCGASHGHTMRYKDSCRVSPACMTSTTIRTPNWNPVYWCTATTRRCSSPTPRTSANAHSLQSTRFRDPSNGSCSTLKPTSRST